MRRLALIAAAAFALGAAGACGTGPTERPVAREPIALFTTLPLLWSEAPDMAAMLKADAPPHWARAVMAERGALTPLDTLAGAQGLAGAPGLTRATRLVMAQPRPLSPEENLALDRWVRAGGRLLLLADPALTEDSAFAIGDQRRPHDIVMLSPILARWGLRLAFDDAQALGEHDASAFGAQIPVNLPGAFVAAPAIGGGEAARCRIEASGLTARCRVGRGTVTALADAAVLERGEDSEPRTSRSEALRALLAAGFD